MNINKKILLASCIFATTIVVSYANQGEQRSQGKRTPPKEAITACKNKEVGTTCTMSTPRGDLSGQCMNTPDKKYFVCMPEGGPDRH